MVIEKHCRGCGKLIDLEEDLCPLCKTIGRIFILGQPGQERAKCPACNQEFDL